MIDKPVLIAMHIKRFTIYRYYIQCLDKNGSYFVHMLCKTCPCINKKIIAPSRYKDRTEYKNQDLSVTLKQKDLIIRSLQGIVKISWNVRQFSCDLHKGIFIADHIVDIPNPITEKLNSNNWLTYSIIVMFLTILIILHY